jgi:hypothetical protein
MDYSDYPSDDPYSRRRSHRVNYFAWSIAILLLTGFALAAWLGSFYIFDQPERPDTPHLQRLHKIEAPKRFELTRRRPVNFSQRNNFTIVTVMGSPSWPGQCRARAELHS